MNVLMLAWVGGLLLVQTLPQLPPTAWCAAVLPGVVLLLIAPRTRAYAALLGGLCWGIWRADVALDARLPVTLEGTARVLRGEIRDLPARTGSGTRFVLENATAATASRWPDGRQRLRLSVHGAHFTPMAGSTCTLYVRLRQPRGTRSPGAFDAEQWYFGQGIDALGYVIGHPGNRCAAHDGFSWGRLRDTLTSAIRDRVSDSDAASILAALTVGASAEISDRQWEILRNSGVVHLISVSGLHVAMVALGGFAVARVLNAALAVVLRREPVPHVPAIAAFALAGGYALLAGFSIPTQRSLAMIALALVNRWRARPLVTAESLLWTACLLLTASPEASLTASFWLSFGALALLLLLDWMRRRNDARYRWLGVHAVLALLLAPLLAFTFQSLPLLSPLANAVAIPLVTFLIVPLCLVGAAVWPLGEPWASLCFMSAARLWSALWVFLAPLGSTQAVFTLPYAVPPILFVLALGGVALALSPLPRGRTPWLAVLVILCRLSPRPPLRDGEFEVAMLDVGQGLSVVISTARHVLVYDAGARFAGGGDQGALVVAPFLRARGVEAIDNLVVSHGDIDHAGGAQSLARALPVGTLLAGDAASLATVNAAARDRCQAGQRWGWDGVTFEVLSPEHPESAPSDNDGSCVVRVSSTGYGHVAVLPGDIGAATEQRLAAAERLAPATLVVVPHHGSRSSSSPRFVAALNARYALVSAGHRNRFNHPAPEVRERYRAGGSRVIETARAGSVWIRLGARIEIDSSRAHRRYWDPG